MKIRRENKLIITQNLSKRMKGGKLKGERRKDSEEVEERGNNRGELFGEKGRVDEWEVAKGGCHWEA